MVKSIFKDLSIDKTAVFAANAAQVQTGLCYYTYVCKCKCLLFSGPVSMLAAASTELYSNAQ